MYSPADTVIRAGKSLAVHIVFGLLLYALAVLLLSDFDSASQSLREQYEEAEVMQLLAASRTTIVAWYASSLALSWVFSAIFLWVANYRQSAVRHRSNERLAMPVWVVMFVLSIAATALLWFRMVSLADVATMLLDGDYLLLVSLGELGQALAMWAGSGLAVTLALKPSVPLAETLLPEIWN